MTTVLYLLAIVGYLSICASLGLLATRVKERSVERPLARAICRARGDLRAKLPRDRVWSRR